MSSHTSTAMMSAPSSASRMACSRPWPRAAPVMNATLPATLPTVFVIVTSRRKSTVTSMKLISPTDSMFLIGESREHPMHVAGLQLFRAARGQRPRLHPRPARDDRQERRLPADVQKASRPNARRHLQRRLGVRRRRRHRLPPAQVGFAASRPHPRVARAGVAAARHTARPAPAAVGGKPRRGSGRRPFRDLHQDPPLAARRYLRAAPHDPVDDDRPRRPRDPGAVDARPEAQRASVPTRRGRPCSRSPARSGRLPRWLPRRCRWPGPRCWNSN